MGKEIGNVEKLSGRYQVRRLTETDVLDDKRELEGTEVKKLNRDKRGV